MKTTTLAAILWLVCIAQLWGQPAWEGGFFLGGATYQGDLVESLAPEFSEIQPAGGIFTRFYLGSSLSLRTNLLYAQFTGSDQNFENPGIREKRNFSFSSRLGEASLLLELDPLGGRRFPKDGGYRKTVSPFVFGGIGLGYLDPSPDFGKNGVDFPSGVAEDKQADFSAFRLSLPTGLGLRFDIGKKVSFNVMATAHYLITDYLDGISESANPDANDWLWTGGLQISIRFAPKDTDDDGIADKEDSCPMVAGAVTADGCPDSDGDGVEDLEDVCPDVAGAFLNNGCPDSDGDGIMDLIDDCPEVFGFDETNGCPDRDNDCVADAQDKCPDREGLPEYDGCPDIDNDGFPDHMDPCPMEAGLAENGGCPLPDSDCDGLLDRDDYCPRMDGGEHPYGCPDTDEDGIADKRDQCPEMAGPEETGGCPDLEEEEKELIASAKGSIRFRTGSAVLLEASKEVLDEIVKLMRKYPYYHLRIHGYTDSSGNDDANLRLSKQRAEACYDYLLYKGIGPARMSHDGFGEADPIGDNDTALGRFKNRRVEFEMYVPEET
jgi:OOP family OmpA-OmpF porin